MRISAFNRSCERKQSRIYPSRSLKKVAISFDHDPILFSATNPADEVFGRHSTRPHLCPPCGKVDMPGQSLAYVYGRESRADADTATHIGRGSTHREQHRQAALIAETAIGCRINYFGISVFDGRLGSSKRETCSAPVIGRAALSSSPT